MQRNADGKLNVNNQRRRLSKSKKRASLVKRLALTLSGAAYGIIFGPMAGVLLIVYVLALKAIDQNTFPFVDFEQKQPIKWLQR